MAALDTPALSEVWVQAEAAFWPLGWFRRRTVAAAIAPTAGGRVSQALVADLPKLAEMRRLEPEIDGLTTLQGRGDIPWERP